jgi:hypothetical protein
LPTDWKNFFTHTQSLIFTYLFNIFFSFHRKSLDVTWCHRKWALTLPNRWRKDWLIA